MKTKHPLTTLQSFYKHKVFFADVKFKDQYMVEVHVGIIYRMH